MSQNNGFSISKLILVLAVVGILTVIATPSCQLYTKGIDLPHQYQNETNYSIVRTHYATDRNAILDSGDKLKFGTERSHLSFGVCDVSIPQDHKMGDLESPRWWKAEFRENPEKHVVLLSIAKYSEDEFFQTTRSKVKSSSGNSAFIFIHGYNVTFEDAARRTAQMAYDLAFEGAPVFYSWPSQGSTPSYTVDETNIQWSEKNIKSFLMKFLEHSGADNIYLIAHSMGNRGATRALASIFVEHPEYRKRFSEIILTAPDIDSGIFLRDIVPNLVTEEELPVTLYASSEDKAIIASREIHQNPRAGEAGKNIVIAKGIETIDSTGMDTSFLKHSYYAETKSVLSDMFYLINDRKRARNRFGLQEITESRGIYWQFKP